MTDGPAPTAEGHEWRCCGCPWRGRTLVAAKGHMLEGRASVLPHHPFECPVGATDVMSKVATRIMLPGERDRAMVSTYRSARTRLYKLLDGIGPARRRRG